jgi:hypothetical protein
MQSHEPFSGQFKDVPSLARQLRDKLAARPPGPARNRGTFHGGRLPQDPGAPAPDAPWSQGKPSHAPVRHHRHPARLHGTRGRARRNGPPRPREPHPARPRQARHQPDPRCRRHRARRRPRHAQARAQGLGTAPPDRPGRDHLQRASHQRHHRQPRRGTPRHPAPPRHLQAHRPTRRRRTVHPRLGPRPHTTAPRPDDDAEAGRGLLIVAALASRWGWHPARNGGKYTWATLPLGARPPGGQQGDTP